MELICHLKCDSIRLRNTYQAIISGLREWRDGEMARWRDGEMKRWRDSETSNID